MSKSDKSFKTPLGKVLGLGSAKAGTELFWRQRLTAVSNIVLITIFVIVLLTLVGQPYPVVRARLGSPFVSILILGMLVSALIHMRIGMQEVIDDYIHGRLKTPLTMLNIFFPLAVGLGCAYAVAKLALGV
jgi:succinate dehydrogenase / fumarate reductase membrane anchor subunit